MRSTHRGVHLALWGLASLVTAGSLTSGAASAAPSADGCGWRSKLSTDGVNVLFIDEAAAYWSADVEVPDGGHVELTGEFPHARYMSLVVYDERGATVDHLTDLAIDPDPGHENPFVPGAYREAAKRSYRVRLVDERAPTSGRPANTLFTESADGLRRAPGPTVRVTMRIYAPDAGFDALGGTDLPVLETVAPDGSRAALRDCIDAASDPLAGIVQHIDVTRRLAPPEPGRLTWQRFLPDGLGENVDASYVYAPVTRAQGVVLVLRAERPTSPTTTAGDDEMGEGDLRYWSLCAARPDTSIISCLYDEEIPSADDGTFTVVVTTPENRPPATTDADVAWLPAAEDGTTLIVLRHVLPAPDFDHAVQRIEGDEVEAALGAYLPTPTFYETVEDYEASLPEPAAPEPTAPDPVTAASDEDGLPAAAVVAGATAVLLGAALAVRRLRA